MFIVFIGNLTWTTTDAELMEFAEPIGVVVSAKVQRHRDTLRSKGWGLVVKHSIAIEI